MKEAINVWHKPGPAVFKATLYISCLLAANTPWVMMKRFTKQKRSGRERERQRERGREGEAVGEKKGEGTNTN